MATLTTLVDFTVPTAADFMDNFEAINDEVRPTTTGGTGLSSYTAGDTIYASATNTLGKLGIGTRGQAYTVGGSTVPTWQATPVPRYYSRLRVTRPTAATVTVTADALTVVNASGHPILLTGVSVTADITVVGANGLESGTSESADTWYSVWVIYNGTTVAALLSDAFSLGTITLPSGYTFGQRVSIVRNDGSSNFFDFRQYGGRYYYAGDATDGPRIVFTNTTGVTTYTLLALDDYVTAFAQVVSVFGIMGADQAAATAGMAVAWGDLGERAAIALGDSAGATTMMGWNGAWPFEIYAPINEEELWWRAPATTADAYRLGIRGFEFQVVDV